MNLGLRQKFSLLAFLAGGLFAVMSIIGYYTSFLNLSETLTSEILAIVDSQGKEMNTWLKSKAVAAQYTADLLGNLGDINRMKNRELQGLTTSDKDILEVTIGLRDKYFLRAISPAKLTRPVALGTTTPERKTG